MFDNPRTYRTEEEESHWRARDPLKQFREAVIPQGDITAEELDQIDKESEDLMEEAIKFADDSPMPEPLEIYDDVYVNYPMELLKRGRQHGNLTGWRTRQEGQHMPGTRGPMTAAAASTQQSTTNRETTMTTATGVREIQYREAINEAIRQEMERDESVIIMGEEIAGGAGREHLGIIDAWGGPFRTTVGLIQQFGNQRVLDTPLSEAAFVGAAIGASSTGMRAIAELMFVDFVGVCMDQLLNNAAKMRYMFGGQVTVPFTLLTRIGAGFGSAAQHSESYYSIFSHIPGLKGVAPSDPYTAKGLLIAAIRDDDPVVYFEHKGLYGNTGQVPEEPYEIPLGKAPNR